jgi:hypothetical protein
MLFDVAIIVSILMVFGFAVLQLLLVFGAPFGEYVLGGQHKVLPIKMRLISGVFSFLFMVVGVSYLQMAGAISNLFSPVFIKILLASYTLFLASAIIGNGFITKSKKERYVMTPCSIAGFLGSIIVLTYSYAL